MAQPEVEALREWSWRVVGDRRALDISSATWARLVRELLAVILDADDTGERGGYVASSWTSWDGRRLAVGIAVEGGKKGGVRVLVAVVAWAMQGTWGSVFRSGRERRGRGEHGEGRGVLPL